MISLIVARAQNGAIGRDGDIPWHVPEDLKAFQRETSGGAVIMGRNTWDSLPAAFRPLKGRLNCVVSRSDVGADVMCRSLPEALKTCADAGYMRIYGIGGAGIYAGLLPYAHRLVITDVETSVPDADTFFPEFEKQDWAEQGAYELRVENPRCVMREWLRRDAPLAF